jgi:hypothetical protein
MKTGRPDYYIPSPTTVSRDVKKVFVNVRKRMAKMLREYEGDLNFATDAWTSPNHKAFVAVTVHFQAKGSAVTMLLDLVEVATSHSGLNLATAFAKILDDFGISDKVHYLGLGSCERCRKLTVAMQVLSITCDNASCNDTMIDKLEDMIPDFPGAPNRTRCFNHIVALVAVRVVRQFDVPKGGEADVMNEAVQELRELAKDSDVEESITQREWESAEDDDEDDGDIADLQGDELIVLDHEALNASLKPGRTLLVKASRLTKKGRPSSP